MKSLVLFTICAICALLGNTVEAQNAESTKQPQLSLEVGTEDGKKVVIARATLEEKPLEGVKIAFFVKRTFGMLPLGEEETLEDGTAAVPFPEGLPGGTTGELSILAELKGSSDYGPSCCSGAFPGGVVVPVQKESFPPALWSPTAPRGLLLTIATLLGIVWCTYLFVIIQLSKIRKGEKDDAEVSHQAVSS